MVQAYRLKVKDFFFSVLKRIRCMSILHNLLFYLHADQVHFCDSGVTLTIGEGNSNWYEKVEPSTIK